MTATQLRKRPPLFRRVALIVVAFAVAVLAGATALRAMSPHLYTGTVLQQSRPAPAMDDLVYGDGSTVDLNAYDGQVVLVYFGYTHCPDVCPTALSMAATALRDLGGDRDDVQLLMVTVDPRRDTPAELQEYVEFFDDSFLGASGTADSIDRVAAQYGIFSQLGDGDVESGYVVDHTATMLAIGTDGALRIVWPPDVTAPQLAADIKELLRQ